MAWVLLFTSIFAIGGGALAGRPIPKPTFESVGVIVGCVVGMGLLVGFFVFAVGLVWGSVLGPGTLRASTLWGRMVEVPLASITDVRAGSVSGMPVLILKSSAATSELYVYTLGVDRASACARLNSLVGPDNLLTQAFSSDGV